MHKSKNQWFQMTLQLKGSVIPSIWPQTLFFALFGGLIAILHQFGLAASIPILGSVIPSIFLGLLLVFRTNTADERFWECRKAWGTLSSAFAT